MINKIITLLLCLAPIQAQALPPFAHGGSAGPNPPPILDTVPCSSASDAAYGTVLLRTAYAGNAVQMRVLHTGAYVYQDIGFVGTSIDVASADTFAATRDAGTTPEARFYDQCGNSNDTAFSGTSTEKGATWSLYNFGLTSYRTLSFDLLNDNGITGKVQKLILPATIALNQDAFSTALIGRQMPYPPDPMSLWELDNTAPWATRWFGWHNASGINIREKDATTLNYGGMESIGAYQTIAGASTYVVKANEVSTSLAKETIGATSNNGGYLGWNSSTANWFGGQDIIAQMFFNRILSASEQSTITAYAYRLEGDQTAIANCIVVVGDSLSQGTDSMANQNYINQAVHGGGTLITKRFRLYNFATGSMTAATMAGQTSRYTSACGNASVSNKLAIVLAGANDQLAGTSANTIVGYLTTICTALHNAGFKVVLASLPKNSLANNGTILPALNALIEANYVSYGADALADIWTDPTIGSAGNTGNTTYYYTDGTHFTVAGYSIFTNHISPAVNGIF